MGDRLNIEFRFPATFVTGSCRSVHLYSHWDGHYILHGRLQEALEGARGRWDDHTYCARIIMSQLIRNNWDQNLSWGISPNYTDSEYGELIIHLGPNTVEYDGRTASFEQVIEEGLPTSDTEALL